MTTKKDILASGTETTYSLWATHNGEDWFTLGARKSEYQSPKKLLSAIAATPYPPDLSSFKEVIMVENTKTVECKIIPIPN